MYCKQNDRIITVSEWVEERKDAIRVRIVIIVVGGSEGLIVVEGLGGGRKKRNKSTGFYGIDT